VPAVYLNREERPARTMAGSLGFTERFSARNKVNAAVEVSGAEHCRGPAARRSVAMDRFKARDEAAAGIGQAEGGDEWFFGLPSNEEVLPDPVERGREHSSHDVGPRLLDVGPEPTHQRSTAVKFSDRFGDTHEGCVLAIDRPLDALSSGIASKPSISSDSATRVGDGVAQLGSHPILLPDLGKVSAAFDLRADPSGTVTKARFEVGQTAGQIVALGGRLRAPRGAV